MEGTSNIKTSSEVDINKMLSDVHKSFQKLVISGKMNSFQKLFHELTSNPKVLRQMYDPKLIAQQIFIVPFNFEAVLDDIILMVFLYLMKGNNLENIEKTIKPKYLGNFRRLVKTYNLVSNVKSSYSVTLRRVSDTFPTITCNFVKSTKFHMQLWDQMWDYMKSISNNYPKVMLTSAFAYFIPKNEKEYCYTLKLAYMLFKYMSYINTKRGMCYNTISEIDVVDADIVTVYFDEIREAIDKSLLSYDTQINFLKKNDIIVVAENTEIAVTECVSEAAKIWTTGIMKRFYKDLNI